MSANYTKVGPFTNGAPPALNAGNLNALEAGIIAAANLAVSITPAMSQSQIQTVLNSLSSFTRVTFTGTFNLTGPLTIPFDAMHIDAMNATFNTTAWALPVFDAIGRNGVTYDVAQATFTGTRPPAGSGAGQAAAGAAYRGSAPYCSGAAIWINGDYNWVRNLKTSYLPVGVFLSSYAGTSTYDHVGVGNRIGTLEVDHGDWGVLYVGQLNPVFDDIHVHDDIDDSAGGNPTHAIYCSATTSFRSTGGTIRSVRAENILGGQPVQFKFHDDLTVGHIHGTGSMGLLNVIDCNDLKVNGYTSLGTLANNGQGAITFQRSVTNSQRPRFGKGYIQMAANVDERVVNVISDNGTFDEIEIDSNHSAGVNTASTGEIIVRGTGNHFRHPKFRSLGAGSVPAVWIGFSGETANNTIVERPIVSGTLNVAKVDQSSTGVVVDYDAAAQSFTGAAAVDLNGGNTAASSFAPPLTLSTFGEHGIDALVVASGTVSVGGANNALEVRVTPHRNITVSSLVWWSTVASGNYDIGIFDDTSNAWLWSKGTTGWPAAGKITETVPSVKLVAGRTYRFAFSADNATGTLRGVQAAIAGLDLRLDGSTNSTTVSSAFPLPTTTLVAGTNGSTTRIPLIVALGS